MAKSKEIQEIIAGLERSRDHAKFNGRRLESLVTGELTPTLVAQLENAHLTDYETLNLDVAFGHIQTAKAALTRAITMLQAIDGSTLRLEPWEVES